MNWHKRFLEVAVLSIFGLVTTAQAQVEKIEIYVDGLACPFCAYGLEKKLKKIEGVAEVKINIAKGSATLETKQGNSIEVETIESVVKDAGFTPRELTASIIGKISQSGGTSVLSVSEADVIFILRENEQLKDLRSIVKGPQKQVRVTGTIKRETPEEHHAHPYTLTIEKFEVIK